MDNNMNDDDNNKRPTDGHARDRTITRRAHARVGLVGNPSDGFFGKTIAVSVANFWAEVIFLHSHLPF
jgi:hypothetical protein